MSRTRSLWIFWLTGTLLAAAALGYSLAGEKYATLFLAGETTHGHYQIELTCSACHTEPFAGPEVIQQACVDCHGEAMSGNFDTHPASKFNDPREADRMELIDAQMCATCHEEHKPRETHPMGFTKPMDMCVHCHDDIEEQRPSHEGMAMDNCTTSGCHNYHDNRALYESFLLNHAHEPEILADAGVPSREPANLWLWVDGEWDNFQESDLKYSEQGDMDEIHDDWLASAHGEADVGCTSCHGRDDEWQDHPEPAVCSDCHTQEYEGFKEGRHGMRLAVGLDPMTPGEARLPMHEKAHDKTLTCTTCHGPHEMDMETAAVDACLGCHIDEHSTAYEDSPHAELWDQALAGERPMEEAVTCATCHLPREETSFEGHDRILVQHNQNRNLRPNEKMARSVCMDCHGLQFTLDALASPEQARTNFSSAPEHHVESIDMALDRKNPKE